MPQDFYLSSHDIGPDTRPRKCEVQDEVEGMRANSHYVLVKIVPSLTTRFWDGPVRDFDRIILSIIGQRTLQDVGVQPVSVEIVLCPTYAEGLVDEGKCSKIGIGGLHATYAEALEKSPVEAR